MVATVRPNRSLELLEESLHILRGAGMPILLRQWTGAIPFAVALLLLVHYAGVSWGRTLLLRDSLACAIAFMWLSYWKSRAATTISTLLSPALEPSASQVITQTITQPNRAALQAVFQTLKLFVMPFAVISIFAWPFASVFFRTLALEPLPGSRPLRSGFQRAFESASSRYKETFAAFLAIAALTLVTFLNVLVTLFLAPTLWKMLTGSETDWSRMQNDNTLLGLFAVAVMATWLLVDPWIQTYCVLRVFYQTARSDGRDLLREISRLAAVLVICLFGYCASGNAQTVRTQESLNRSINHVAQGEDYGWLRPQKAEAQGGFLKDLAQKVADAIHAAQKQVKAWYQALKDWMNDKLGRDEGTGDFKEPGLSSPQELRWVLAILAMLICGGIVAIFLRNGRTRVVKTPSATTGTTQADVLNEQILPSDVNHEEWLRLAFEYLANNQTRLSARAFYLANLSYLGTQSLLSLSLSKSNRLYERELARQPKSREISAAFFTGNRLYERAWFGMRELGVDQMETLKGAAEQLRQHA